MNDLPAVVLDVFVLYFRRLSCFSPCSSFSRRLNGIPRNPQFCRRQDNPDSSSSCVQFDTRTGCRTLGCVSHPMVFTQNVAYADWREFARDYIRSSDDFAGRLEDVLNGDGRPGIRIDLCQILSELYEAGKCAFGDWLTQTNLAASLGVASTTLHNRLNEIGVGDEAEEFNEVDLQISSWLNDRGVESIQTPNGVSILTTNGLCRENAEQMQQLFQTALHLAGPTAVGQPGYVYLIRQGVTDLYKIGFTNRPLQERLPELQTGNPHRLRVVAQMHAARAKLIEDSLHLFCIQYNVRDRLSGGREWFRFADPEVTYLTAIFCRLAAQLRAD
jgi:hypothetical protein